MITFEGTLPMTPTRQVVLATAALVLLAMPGCRIPPAGVRRESENSAANTEDVILLDRYVGPRVYPDRVSILRTDFSTNESGYPMMQCEMRNLRTGKELRFDIRTVFKDEHGAAVDTTAWSPMVLAPGETFTYRGLGTRKDATDAQVQIRKLR